MGHPAYWSIEKENRSVGKIMRVIVNLTLVGCRNPCSLSKVQVQGFCLLNDSLLQLSLSSPNNRKGVTNESFSKIITDDLALLGLSVFQAE